MKRHPSLQDLSRDHHVVLVLAKQIREGLQDLPSAREQGQRLLAFWERELQPHFDEEEQVILPPLERRLGATDLRLRTIRDDHRWIRGRIPELARQLDHEQDPTPLLGVLASRIGAHVRFEENELFETAQRLLDDDEMGRLGATSHTYRAKHRQPGGCQLP